MPDQADAHVPRACSADEAHDTGMKKGNGTVRRPALDRPRHTPWDWCPGRAVARPPLPPTTESARHLFRRIPSVPADVTEVATTTGAIYSEAHHE